MRREDIKEVQLKAGVNGNDGWYINSINTYTAAGNNRKYDLLTTDPGFTMWVDANEPHLYPYIAKKHLLTKVVVSDCISYVKVEAKTGDEPYADVSGTNHLIVLKLEDDTGVQAEIEGPINRNAPYSIQLHFTSRFETTECVKIVDIREVHLKTQIGGNDGWYIASINTFVKSGISQYEQVTSNPNFNKWLDGDGQYPYDATDHLLTWVHENTPDCGYGKPVCECSKYARICTFNLEIDEIQTFTSYQRFPLESSPGMYLRGTQGVTYYINNSQGRPQKFLNR